MMTFDKLNETDPALDPDGKPPTGDTPETGATVNEGPQDANAADPSIIIAELPHPATHGGPLSRGARYLHHFEVELISDGKRLWHVLSVEGQAVVAALFGERQAEQDAIHAAKTAGK